MAVIGGLGFLGGSFLRYVEALETIEIPALREVAPADAIVVLTGGPDRLEMAGRLLKARLADRLFVSGVGEGAGPGELRAMLGTSERLFDCCVRLGFEALDTRGNGLEIARWLMTEGLAVGEGRAARSGAATASTDQAADIAPATGIAPATSSDPVPVGDAGFGGMTARAATDRDTADPGTPDRGTSVPTAREPDMPGTGPRGGTPRVLVVTSNYHMRRALFELRRARPGIDWIAHPVTGIDIAAEGWWREATNWRVLVAEHAKYLLAGARRWDWLDRLAARLLGPSRPGSGVGPAAVRGPGVAFGSGGESGPEVAS